MLVDVDIINDENIDKIIEDDIGLVFSNFLEQTGV